MTRRHSGERITEAEQRRIQQIRIATRNCNARHKLVKDTVIVSWGSENTRCVAMSVPFRSQKFGANHQTALFLRGGNWGNEKIIKLIFWLRRRLVEYLVDRCWMILTL